MSSDCADDSGFWSSTATTVRRTRYHALGDVHCFTRRLLGASRLVAITRFPVGEVYGVDRIGRCLGIRGSRGRLAGGCAGNEGWGRRAERKRARKIGVGGTGV